MRKLVVVGAVIGLLTLLAMASAWAQQGPRTSYSGSSARGGNPLDQRPSRPAVSPWLDLTRRGQGGGGSAAFNYHRRILPERELRAADVQQRGQIQQLGQTLSTLQRSGSTLQGTGHPVRFMDYSQYFPQQGR